MTKKKLYTLGKNERLKSRRLIEQLFKEGKSFSVFPIRIIYLNILGSCEHEPSIVCLNSPGSCHHEPAQNISLKAGFTVGTKHFKKAVDRNRIKRQMKEAYRLQKNDLKDILVFQKKHLALFFIYLGNELPEYDLIKNKMNAGLKRIKKIVDENNLGNP